MKKATLSFRHYAELLDDIIYQSEFRAEKDIQYPDDERNARAAEGLTEMAAWFKRQDNDSPLMVRLATDGRHIQRTGHDHVVAALDKLVR